MPIIDNKKLSREVASKYKLISNSFRQIVKDNPKDRVTIEVGDVKDASEFYPQVKINRWGTSEDTNEVNFSIRLKEDDYSGATVETEGEVIKWSKGEREVHLYDKPDVSEDGGFELETILKSKPVSNILEFTIQTKGLNFFHQPELTPEEVAEGAFRPPEVVNSYAVYHSTKGGMNDAAGMEYKAGKAFHIYRPKVTDANGVETWGELNIDEQNWLLNVTIDQGWLDNAVYPVIVDPTFGYTTAGGTSASFSLGTNKYCSLVSSHTANTGDTLNSISLYGSRADTSDASCDVAIYQLDSGTTPNARASTPATLTFSSGNTWQTTSELSTSLSNGIIYGVSNGAWKNAPNRFNATFDEGSAPGRISSTTNPLGDPFSATGTDSGRHYSIYATYTAGGAGSSSVSPSLSPSSSVSPSSSLSPSASVSRSISPSASVSPSLSPSASISPSSSVSRSLSPSSSVSPSVSPSASISPSFSVSASLSPSASVSPSTSVSPSASASPSGAPQTTQYITLVAAESDWYITRSGLPEDAPLNAHKREYWIAKGIPASGVSFLELEKAWLRSFTSSNSNSYPELWRQAVSSQGLTPFTALNANKFAFYTSVTSNP